MMKRIITFAICFCALFASSVSLSKPEFESKVNITPQGQEYSSPERTWDLFKNALIDGDYELAHKCCCPGSNRFISKFEKLGTAKTKDIFQSMKRIEKIYQHDDKAKYRVHRDINGTELDTFVFFNKINNEWKIDKY